MTENDPATCPRCGHPSLDHYRGFCHHPAGAVAMCGCRVIRPEPETPMSEHTVEIDACDFCHLPEHRHPVDGCPGFEPEAVPSAENAAPEPRWLCVCGAWHDGPPRTVGAGFLMHEPSVIPPGTGDTDD